MRNLKYSFAIPSSLEDRRARRSTDSVADRLASIHARTKTVLQETPVQPHSSPPTKDPPPSQSSSSRKGSYSLYPNCTPTSPVSPISTRIPDFVPPRSSSSTLRSTTQSVSAGNDQSSLDGTGEPLVDHFQSRLMTSPRQLQRENSLPGLSMDGPAVPARKASIDATSSHDFANTRQLKSVTQHPTLEHQHRRSRSDLDGFGSSGPNSPEMRQGSSNGSFSEASTAPSEPVMVALQTHGLQDGEDQMCTVSADDPKNFDLIAAPPEETRGIYAIEERADRLFSKDHLKQIFADPRLLLHFTSFLNSHRPKSVRTLIYYLDALKAIRAIRYANAITDGLDPLHGHDFASSAPPRTSNKTLEERAEKAFDLLAADDLPAYIAFMWIQVVSESVQKRVTGTLPPHLREASEGLAEVFCLSDPSRPDNPIVFASEEFQRTTQYGMNYCVGRNCRFLQGPRTSRRSVSRLRDAILAGRETTEVFLNYRRDGSPFMNLLMSAPLHDAQGNIRYFIGAQVDVSGLVKDATDLEGLRRLLRRDTDVEFAHNQDKTAEKDDFDALAEMFNKSELEAVRKHGGHMHRSHFDDDDDTDSISDKASIRSSRPRLLLTDPTSDILDRATSSLPSDAAAAMRQDIRASGRLQGVYQHYLLIRPAPSLRILFTSPSLRIPGILQTPFLDRVGGSSRVRDELSSAFGEGRGVTAKIRWLTRPDSDDDEGRSRWIHATPLLNHRGEIGVWMVVLVDAESAAGEGRKRFRNPPAVQASPALGDQHDSVRGYSVSKSKRSPGLASQRSPTVSESNAQRFDVSRRPKTLERKESNRKREGIISFFDGGEDVETRHYSWADRALSSKGSGR